MESSRSNVGGVTSGETGNVHMYILLSTCQGWMQYNIQCNIEVWLIEVCRDYNLFI